jgi:hypothetical protein
MATGRNAHREKGEAGDVHILRSAKARACVQPLPGDDEIMAWGKDLLPSWVPAAEELSFCESEFVAGQTPECDAQSEQPALVNR